MSDKSRVESLLKNCVQEKNCNEQEREIKNGGQSPIIISDSEQEYYESSESEAEMETDELARFFNPSTDAFVQKSLLDDKLRIHSWLLQLFRKCQMMSEIYHLQKNSTHPCQPKIGENIKNGNRTEILAAMLGHIKDRNRSKKTSFFVFRELLEFLKSSRNSAVLDPSVYTKICYILEEFALGPSFEPENYRILQNFHQARFMAQNENIESIFVAWRRSPEYDPEMENIMLYDRKFTEGLLYGPVMVRLEQMVDETAKLLPTILEIASFDIFKFLNLFMSAVRVRPIVWLGLINLPCVCEIFVFSGGD